MKFLSKTLFVLSIFFTQYFVNAQCSDEIQNLATGNEAIVFSYHNKVAGADCVAFYNDNTQVTVSNNDINQPWSRYLVKFNMIYNGLAAGDQILVNLDAEVGNGGQGRVEFNLDNTPNSAIGAKTFNTSGNYNAILTIPSGITNMDIWLFSNYNLSTSGDVIYKNLSVQKVTAGDTQNPTAPTNLITSNVTDSSVNLSWTASTDNVGVTSYTLFTNNTNGVNVGNGTSHQVTGLDPSTTYSFLLQALDAAGNVSGNSNTITATTSSGGSGQWVDGTNGIHYSEGNVGIGTSNPDAPLTVNGRIHTTEVKVDLLGALAPDYVFYDDYNLRTLEEVQRHIDEHGHLPNIPSAKEMEKEGLYLKEMNLKLLEKIEELTLYLLEQDKAIKDIQKKLKNPN